MNSKSNILGLSAAFIAISLSILFRLLLQIPMEGSEIIALFICTWLLYGFDQYIDHCILHYEKRDVIWILKSYFSHLPFQTCLIVFPTLFICTFFVSLEAYICLLITTPLLVLYFTLVLNDSSFQPLFKSLFASILFLLGCLSGKTMFQILKHEESTILVSYIWILLFQNMWLSKRIKEERSVLSMVNIMATSFGIVAIFYSFFKHQTDTAPRLSLLIILVFTSLTQISVSSIWPKSKRWLIDLVLFSGLLLALSFLV